LLERSVFGGSSRNCIKECIDSNIKLKNWYIKQGFKETETNDFPRLPFRVCFMNKQIENLANWSSPEGIHLEP